MNEQEFKERIYSFEITQEDIKNLFDWILLQDIKEGFQKEVLLFFSKLNVKGVLI